MQNKIFKEFKTNSYLIVRLTILAVLIVALFVNKKAKAQLENIVSISSTNSDTKNYAGINSLMTAISENDIEGVSFFVKANPKLINEENVGGATPLHIAARIGNLEITSILLENDASINSTDNEKWTPLMRAAMAGNGSIVGALLNKGANILQTNSAGEGAIIHATMSGCNECLTEIVNKAKSDPINLSNSSNKQLMSDQLTAAYTIAQSKQNKDAQATLSDFLNYIAELKKQKIQIKNNQNSPQGKSENSSGNNFDTSENLNEGEVVIIQEIQLDPIKKKNKTPQKFVFVKGSDGKERVKVSPHTAKKYKMIKPAKTAEISAAKEKTNEITQHESVSTGSMSQETSDAEIKTSIDGAKFKFVKGADPVKVRTSVKSNTATKNNKKSAAKNAVETRLTAAPSVPAAATPIKPTTATTQLPVPVSQEVPNLPTAAAKVQAPKNSAPTIASKPSSLGTVVVKTDVTTTNPATPTAPASVDKTSNTAVIVPIPSAPASEATNANNPSAYKFNGKTGN